MNNKDIPNPVLPINDVKLCLEIGRASAIYAEESFTVYLKVKNTSGKVLFLYWVGILESTEFKFVRADQEENNETTEPEKWNGRDPTQSKSTSETRLLQDKLKTDCLCKFNDNPWELSPGESVTVPFIGTTKNSRYFRPDTYKLVLFADIAIQQLAILIKFSLK